MILQDVTERPRPPQHKEDKALNISCTLSGIADPRHPAQGILDIAGSDFKSICFDTPRLCPPEQLEKQGKQRSGSAVAPETARIAEDPTLFFSYAKPTLDLCAEHGLRCAVMIAPYLKRDTVRSDFNALIERLAEECIKICGNCLIVRPLSAGISKERLWEENRRFYARLAVCAGPDVQILLENQCREIGGHPVRGVCADPDTAAAWVDRLNEEAGGERFGFCLNVGTCNLCGQNMRDFMMTLGKRLKAVIIRDNDGSTESSQLPFTSVAHGASRTNWLDVIRGLRELAFDGELIFDIEDTARAFSPMLRPQLLRMTKSVADFFRWQIEMENVLKEYSSRVLFGAGNMCRNYMKCYGEKYPPLFTCDNNSGLWDTEFCGLKVRAPEALKELPQDCVIFICNIYYREIEAQIKQMGIKNRIEFFNDEYMPDFHFDRVEDRGRMQC